MDGVLNVVTQTVHRHKRERSDLESACGATYHLERDQLRMTSVAQAVDESHAAKCGRCFEDGGGY